MLCGEGEICERSYIVKRILLLAILFAIIMIGGTGCMFDNKPKQDVNELALEYLEQKYGEKFEYYAPAGSSYTGTRTFLATCESLGDKTVVVQIVNYKSEDRQFKDNYLELKYADRLYDYFCQIIGKQFDEFKLFYYPMGMSLTADLPADAPFEDYLKDPSNNISNVMVVAKKSDYKDKTQLSQILETIASECAAEKLLVTVLVLDDSKYVDCELEEARAICNAVNGKFYYAQGEILRAGGKTSIDYYGGE